MSHYSFDHWTLSHVPHFWNSFPPSWAWKPLQLTLTGNNKAYFQLFSLQSAIRLVYHRLFHWCASSQFSYQVLSLPGVLLLSSWLVWTIASGLVAKRHFCLLYLERSNFCTDLSQSYPLSDCNGLYHFLFRFYIHQDRVYVTHLRTFLDCFYYIHHISRLPQDFVITLQNVHCCILKHVNFYLWYAYLYMFLCFIAIACTCIYTTFQTGVFLSAVRLCA